MRIKNQACCKQQNSQEDTPSTHGDGSCPSRIPATPLNGEARDCASVRPNVMRPSRAGGVAKLRETYAYTEGRTCSEARSKTDARLTTTTVHIEPSSLRRGCSSCNLGIFRGLETAYNTLNFDEGETDISSVGAHSMRATLGLDCAFPVKHTSCTA